MLYAKRIARTLGVSVDYLIGMYEDDEEDDVEPAGVVVSGLLSLRQTCSDTDSAASLAL